MLFDQRDQDRDGQHGPGGHVQQHAGNTGQNNIQEVGQGVGQQRAEEDLVGAAAIRAQGRIRHARKLAGCGGRGVGVRQQRGVLRCERFGGVDALGGLDEGLEAGEHFFGVAAAAQGREFLEMHRGLEMAGAGGAAQGIYQQEQSEDAGDDAQGDDAGVNL